MAELPHLGKHCHKENCKQLDFLPFTCDSCHQTFCLDHRSPDSHGCLFVQNKELQDEERKIQNKTLSYKCSVPDCKKSELVPIVCEQCEKNFCFSHRHREDHQCKNTVSQPQMTETAKLVQNILEAKAAQPKKNVVRGKKSERTAAQVQLMKMKMKAVGNNTIPQTERVYFRIFFPERHKEKVKDFFFSKVWKVGKVVDTIAAMEKLENNNNIATAQRLQLFKGTDGTALDMGVSLELLQEEVLSGSSLILEYVSPGTEHLFNFESYLN